MIAKSSNFRILHETNKFILGYLYETACLVSKKTKKEIHIGDFYGEPACGLISPDNDWCIVAGDIIVIWKLNIGIQKITDDYISWVIKMRLTSGTEIELLIDPWSNNGSIWRLNIETLKKEKIKDFYIEGENTEDIIW